MLRVIARHADEWNMPSHEGTREWGEANTRLDEACAEVGRDPADVRRSVQLFLHPRTPGKSAKSSTCYLSSRSWDVSMRCCRFISRRAELLEKCAALRQL